MGNYARGLRGIPVSTHRPAPGFFRHCHAVTHNARTYRNRSQSAVRTSDTARQRRQARGCNRLRPPSTRSDAATHSYDVTLNMIEPPTVYTDDANHQPPHQSITLRCYRCSRHKFLNRILFGIAFALYRTLAVFQAYYSRQRGYRSKPGVWRDLSLTQVALELPVLPFCSIEPV